jgi:hypothetical protein
MRRAKALAIAAILTVPGIALADDLRGADRMLCAATSVTLCVEGDECYKVDPHELNMPQFIEIDLKTRVLKTTPASGQNRKTDIKNLQRENGALILQGYEMGRAFSFLIDEATGAASIAVARDGIAVAVFGACTPAASPAEPKKP